MLSDNKQIREWANQTPELRKSIRDYAIRHLEYNNAKHGGSWWPVVRYAYNVRGEVMGSFIRLRWYRRITGRLHNQEVK